MAATLLPVVMLFGCSALSHSIISVDGADPLNQAFVSRIAISTEHPVLLRAVDEKLLPSIQISNKIRSVTYALPSGAHVLWLSSVPYGLPFLPQHLKCYVLRATLLPGSTYELRFELAKEVPILSASIESEFDVEGQLVDEPFILERGCQWR